MPTNLAPKISVIVPCYNTAHYLPSCLNSLATQTHSDFEVVCINDGSTDATGRLLDNFAASDERFSVVHQEHQGPAAARNTGIVASTAPLITFVDSDDYVSIRYLEVLEALIESCDADIACGKHVTAYPGASKSFNCSDTVIVQALEKTETYDSVTAMQHLALETIHFPFWNKLFKRELLEAYPFPEGMVYEDLHNIGRIICRVDRIVCAPEVLYCYVLREDSVARTCSRSLTEFWQFREAANNFETAYVQCVGVQHATDDAPYCLHLVHNLCAQYDILQRANCDKRQKEELERILYDELDAAWRLALLRGIAAKHPQMLRATLLLRSPVLYNKLKAAYSRIKSW